MFASKEKAAHLECAAECRKEVSHPRITADENENKTRTAKIAKKISDYVKALKPRLLIAADESVFQHTKLARLKGKFLQVEANATIDEICAVVRLNADSVRGIVLADPTALDLGELSRKSGRTVLTLRSGGAA